MDQLGSSSYEGSEIFCDNEGQLRTVQPLGESLAKLRVVDLESGKVRLIRPNEKYACISHEWSKHQKGEDVPARIRNQVLRHQREQSAEDGQDLNLPTAIWIDTVCIDQGDDADKAYWVPRMGDVYSWAAVTYLVLPGVRDVLSLQPFSKRHPCSMWISESADHDCITDDCIKANDFSQNDLVALYNHMSIIMDHGWRERIWIAQEVVISSFIFVMDDSGVMDLRDLYRLCCSLYFEHLQLDLRCRTLTLRTMIWFQQRKAMHRNFHNDALSAALVLASTKGMKATMPPDMYYGICGLLRVDLSYNKILSVKEVKMGLLRALLAAGDVSWIMLYASTVGHPGKGFDFPYGDVCSDFLLIADYNRERPSFTTLRDDKTIEFSTKWSAGRIIGHFSPEDLCESLNKPHSSSITAGEAAAALEAILEDWLHITSDVSTLPAIQALGIETSWKFTTQDSEKDIRAEIFKSVRKECVFGRCNGSSQSCCQARKIILDSNKDLRLTVVRTVSSRFSFVEFHLGKTAQDASHVLRYDNSSVVFAVSQQPSSDSTAPRFKFESPVRLFNHKRNNHKPETPRWDDVEAGTILV